MTGACIKQFEIEERTLQNMWYEIVVKFHGKEIERFKSNTMKNALLAFEDAGYKRV